MNAVGTQSATSKEEVALWGIIIIIIERIVYSMQSFYQ